VPNSEVARVSFDRSGILYRQANGFAPSLDAKSKVAFHSDLTDKVPGLFGVNWQDMVTASGPALVAQETGRPATAEVVEDCQAKLNAAIAGQTIGFQSGTSVLAPESAPILDAVASAMGPCAGTRIQVAGHTDPAGGTRRNQRLSEERANAVVEALMARGIPGTRLQPIGFGESKPVSQGQTPEAYAQNRRIDFKVAAAPTASQ
jgi:OmpA-OmpF porin, OOP family